MRTRIVHDVQVARIVQVQVQVDIVGPNPHPQHVFFEHAKRRKRHEMLPNRQRWNADKANDVRQKALPKLLLSI